VIGDRWSVVGGWVRSPHHFVNVKYQIVDALITIINGRDIVGCVLRTARIPP
jgi:hypothetical protein